MFFIALEKVYGSMRTSGVAQKYVRVKQDMYESCKTVVRCAVGVTEEKSVRCDQNISTRIKAKVYKTLLRAVVLFGLETVVMMRRRQAQLEVAQRKMLRFSLGVTSRDEIQYECIRGTAHVRCVGDKIRESRHVRGRIVSPLVKRTARLET